ncbi:MAG: TerB family tellurite resistance protein [Halioglobus sp.]|nr:TerB family tellurite resistance protein [Halioglobus sp.]
MISALKNLFEHAERESEEARLHRVRLAAAALLIETARADFTQAADEETAMAALLSDALQLPGSEVAELLQDAEDQVDESTSLYEFTRVINDHYCAEEKLQLVGAMWEVAYADGDLDKYEEALIRQVAELTYVPHQDYIKCKLAAAG